MDFEITPYGGCGPIRFGMTMDEVRQAVGVELKQTRLRDSSISPDRFVSLGITVGYRPPGICEFIQFSGPAIPTYRGHPLLMQPYRAVRRFIESIDPSLQTDEAGLRSDALGIALYADAPEKEPDDPVESVGIFDRRYYERYGE